MEVGEGMKESIPPILRPEHVVPVGLQNFAAHFGLAASGETDSETLSAVALTGISMNTNDLRAGDLFVAMPGLKTHGANFISKAVATVRWRLLPMRPGCKSSMN
jgi:UDP-N-acetylmuramoyl-L-alanyl-D-glutamate--2,6-diaminopimelate ligase